MADITSIKWIYPSTFTGAFPEGIKCGFRRMVVNLTSQSDGTGEEDAIKVRKADLLDSNGHVPERLVVEKVEYDISGMSVTLEWDNQSDEVICDLSTGNGCLDWTSFGGKIPDWDDDEALGSTGDILLNTDGAVDGTYNITLTIRLKD